MTKEEKRRQKDLKKHGGLATNTVPMTSNLPMTSNVPMTQPMMAQPMMTQPILTQQPMMGQQFVNAPHHHHHTGNETLSTHSTVVSQTERVYELPTTTGFACSQMTTSTVPMAQPMPMVQPMVQQPLAAPMHGNHLITHEIDKANIPQNLNTVPKSGNYNVGVYNKLSKEPGLR